MKTTTPILRYLFVTAAAIAAAIPPANLLAAPGDLYVVGHGPIFVLHSIFKFTPDGRQSTFASGLDPNGLAFDSAGNLFVASGYGAIYKFTPTGAQSTFALGLAEPRSLAFDSAGNLFVADISGGAILKFTPDGVRSTFASGLDGPQGLAFDSAGNLFVAFGGGILKFAPDGVQSTFALGLAEPRSLAFDNAGGLFVISGGSILKFAPDGGQSTFGPGDATALAFDSAGNMFVADPGDVEGVAYAAIYKLTPSGRASTFASRIVATSLAFQPTQTPTPPPVPMPSLTVSVSPSRINQGVDATFIISASTVNPSDVTTVFYSMAGKAKSGTNYILSGIPGEAEIPAGASSTTVHLYALYGKFKLGTTATLRLRPATSYTLSSPNKATVTILH